MKNKFILEYLSLARLKNYQNHYLGNISKGIVLYKANIRLSQAFYPLLSIIEISLRNAINNHFILYFNDPNWLVTQKAGFMIDNRLRYFNRLQNRTVMNNFYLNSVTHSEQECGNNATHDQIVAKLKFGFWTSLFDRVPFRILTAEPIKIFPYIPSTLKRHDVSTKLNAIRSFRNKIFHFESICFDNSIFNISIAEDTYKNIYEVLSWLSPDYKSWLKEIDYVEYELERIKLLSLNFRSITFYINRFLLKTKFIYFKLLSCTQ